MVAAPLLPVMDIDKCYSDLSDSNNCQLVVVISSYQQQLLVVTSSSYQQQLIVVVTNQWQLILALTNLWRVVANGGCQQQVILTTSSWQKQLKVASSYDATVNSYYIHTKSISYPCTYNCLLYLTYSILMFWFYKHNNPDLPKCAHIHLQ